MVNSIIGCNRKISGGLSCGMYLCMHIYIYIYVVTGSFSG